MSDERWLTAYQRGKVSREHGCTETMTGLLLDHAEAADELIAELAERLTEWRMETSPCDCWRCTSSAYEGLCGFGDQNKTKTDALLARVDALTKDTA